MSDSSNRILKLSAIENLFSDFHTNEITYCHWKSNEHLSASMSGDTDLDVLFDDTQKEKIEIILKKNGFKLFDAIKVKQYQDIVDYLGIDLQSGKIIHLHTHYKLTMGEPYLKGYQINFEEKILKSRELDKNFGIFTINPAFELVLMYLRESLKLRHRDIIRMFLANKVEYNGNILQEYQWLKERTTANEVTAIQQLIFPENHSLYSLSDLAFNRKELRKIAPLVKQQLKSKRLFSSQHALFLRWYREGTVILSKKIAKLFSLPLLTKRINPRGGRVIAIIGADGSGKSTVTANLMQTFEVKLDVYKIYLGRGDGKISFARKLLLKLKGSALSKKKNNSTEKLQGKKLPNKRGFIQSLYKCIEALLVIREKRGGLQQMKKAKEKGLLVICDRYPQNQIMGYNDGPLLHYLSNSKNPVFKFFSKIESTFYWEAENNPPDIVFKLIAEAEVVEKRKPGETSIEKLKEKIAGIKAITFRSPCNVITINAEKPLDEVLTSIKKEIWSIL